MDKTTVYDLIWKYCPHGTEYREFLSIAEYLDSNQYSPALPLTSGDIMIYTSSIDDDKIGRVSFFDDMPHTSTPAVAWKSIGIIRPYSEFIIPRYLFLLMQGQRFRNFLLMYKSISHTERLQCITSDTFVKCVIPVPHRLVQEEIVRVMVENEQERCNKEA